MTTSHQPPTTSHGAPCAPLRIVMDVRRVRDFGIGTYIHGLLDAMAGIDQTNDYILVTLPEDEASLAGLPPNFQIVTYRKTDSYALNHVAFPLFLHGLRPSLVHIPLNQVPLFMREPYVVTIHDMSRLLFDTGSGLRMQTRRLLLRRGLLRAKRIIAVSEATRRDVHDALAIPADRIRVAYNAPNPDFFRPAEAGHARRILERYQIDYPFLLYAGNIRPQKNIPRLVEAFAVARERLSRHPVYRDLHLLIIGDEISRYPSVRRAVIQTRVEKAVRFLGFVPFEALRVFFESAALFVFPSLYEGFGLPPLEAMASGTPVVASNAGALAEVLGDAALLVNPENVFEIARAIQEALLDEDLRGELIAKGKAQAARYSWERTAREVLEVYRDVAQASGAV
ncbi:MAG: glycosyltransferase family 1 protein [Bryobacteraceae bacterium]